MSSDGHFGWFHALSLRTYELQADVERMRSHVNPLVVEHVQAAIEDLERAVKVCNNLLKAADRKAGSS